MALNFMANKAKQLKQDNKKDPSTLEEGDLIEFPRGIYSHWGVYIGDDEIVHISGIHKLGKEEDSSSSNVFTISGIRFKKACVEREKLSKIAGQDKWKKNNDDTDNRPFSGSEIKERALEKIGPISYSVFWKNCEHFATWCRYGIEKSKQADTVLETAVMVGGIAVVGGIVGGLIIESDDKD